ncbi:NAD(P)/FAD-dependent oxidoreductase [Oceanomicrobium pacificus]|uniref:FAD-dependent oxidoreductase n=1 Tax=Oceanomicrobium pacificus TaxID=2692916 RepID=A0A6B0TT34_9RHOB|nr:FAD-dependent oxidoreductase [Oceanomicrobium pacificus]MXU64153.1 FAD-dependent oxidoreductase [Oceanomicrobium pacificus]
MANSGRVTVIGAGIFGLCAAWHLRARGRDVTVVDRRGPGAGASGGLVGALSPHVPDRWNAKKQFQRDALLAAAGFWAEVEAVAGQSSGYGRTGRLLPLPDAHARAIAEERAEGAAEFWAGVASWTVLPPGEDHPFAPDAAAAGIVHETLSARIAPARACATLARALERRGVLFQTGTVMAEPGGALSLDGDAIDGPAVIAAGTGSFDLLRGLGRANRGRGVKGQAALLRPSRPMNGPILYDRGIYVIGHADGTVAVGSTSETEFDDPYGTDALLDRVIADARVLVPSLADAPVIGRWAGLRPRAPERDPMVGPLPDRPDLIVATGGFKTGLALAPRIGDAVAAFLSGEVPDLPDSFAPAHHLKG